MPEDGKNVDIIDPISQYSAFIVRGTILGAGLVGLTLWFKNSRLFAVYQTVDQIPATYFTRGLPLKGKLREICHDGIFKVEHLPHIKLFSKRPNQKMLNLRLAGINVSDAGMSYLKDNFKLENRNVSFNAIKKTEQKNDTVDVELFVKKAVFSTNLNVELIRRGYARVFPLNNPEHSWTLQSNSAYARLITRLLTCEKIAEKRGIGIWERSSWVESLSSMPSTLLQSLKVSPVVKLMVLFYELLRDLFIFVIYLAKQSWLAGEAAIGIARNGYNYFGRGVDSISQAYSSVKSRFQR